MASRSLIYDPQNPLSHVVLAAFAVGEAIKGSTAFDKMLDDTQTADEHVQVFAEREKWEQIAKGIKELEAASPFAFICDSAEANKETERAESTGACPSTRHTIYVVIRCQVNELELNEHGRNACYVGFLDILCGIAFEVSKWLDSSGLSFTGVSVLPQAGWSSKKEAAAQGEHLTGEIEVYFGKDE